MSTHPPTVLVARYAVGGAHLDDASVWAVEAHLEGCAACRTVLAEAVDPDTRALLDRVAGRVAAGVTTGPGPAGRRRTRRTGTATRMLPWLAMAAALMMVAVVFEQTVHALPSVVLLAAPVAPLLPVAAVWSRHTDPAWELTATAARAGLWLLLRRTLGALLAVVPILAAAGWWTGHSPALLLLPCLAFTAASLALGGLVPVDRAALGLALGWSAAVVVPSLSTERLPALLQPGSSPGWALLTAVLLAVVLGRAAAGRRLGAGRG
ncbi:zf-HC2 domain-containing protein [Micromonospora zhanjiangensis]|uniref:Zf-HC2 domain-containing protein n=1 Tax=Micromonospora zhanjiangensis TaxID=1522057 RepID=A0ABV8KQZ6_9ACTN